MSNQDEWERKYGRNDHWEKQAVAANTSYKAGFDDAVNMHKAVVAAAEAVIDAYNDSYKPFEDRMLTLASAVNNLQSSLPWRNWIKQNTP